MNTQETGYFHIDLSLLSEKSELFPFHLYIFHPISKNYTIFLYANSPLTKEKREFLEYLSSKGGEIAISFNQKETFLQNENLTEDQVPTLKEPEIHPLYIKQQERKKKWENQKASQSAFNFKEELTRSVSTDNWSPLINEARSSLMTLSMTRSHTVSLANYLSEHLLHEDCLVNRIVALSYHLAISSKMDDDQSLGDLVCAAFFAHLGFTQIEYRFSHQAHISLSAKDKKEYRKHAGLSQHLIRKSGLIISERCLKIINQHHERFDGSGFPDNKIGSFIEPLALILGASSHLLEYASGKVTGEKVPWPVLINNLKNMTLSPGLELSFGDSIYESIIHLLDQNNETQQNNKKAA